MPRIRTIKPSFFQSEDVSALPLRARLTWIGLWTQCDDAGRTKDNTKLPRREARMPEVHQLPYKKKAIPLAVRREVARRYGAEYGSNDTEAPCCNCGILGRIYWDMIPYWVTFDHELDHLVPERYGGAATADNIVLMCRRCNRRKGSRS